MRDFKPKTLFAERRKWRGLHALCLMLVIATAIAVAASVWAEAQGAASTQVVTDEAAGVVRVMVKGKEVARFDRDGFHVEGNVSYAGKLTDAGSSTGDSSSTGMKSGMQAPAGTAPGGAHAQ